MRPSTPPSARGLTGGWDKVFPAYAQTQLFALVSDIETYPHFIPGCVATRVLERESERSWRVDNLFGFGPVRSRFTSRAHLHPPERLEISSSDGPWRDFRLTWRMMPEGDGCRVGCRFSAEFRSLLTATMARAGLAELERQTIAAFEKRARILYG